MVSVVSMAGFLPGVKCSNCGLEVQLALMGEHICATTAHSSTDSRSSNNSLNAHVSRVASQTRRSNSKRAGRLRVDSSAANRPFLRPNELTPASTATFPQAGDPYTQKTPARKPQHQASRIVLPHSPPSPERTNLACAFPPFPSNIPRTAPPLREPLRPDSPFDKNRLRNQAELYSQGPPPSPPSRYPSSTYSQPRSPSIKTSRRSGFIGTPPAPESQLSAANIPPMPSHAEMAQVLTPQDDRPPPVPWKGHGRRTPSDHRQSSSTTSTDDMPDSLRGRGRCDRPLPSRPLSPGRSQTAPPRNEDDISRSRRPTLSLRSSSQPTLVSPTKGAFGGSDPNYPRSARMARSSPARTPTQSDQSSLPPRPVSQHSGRSPPRHRRLAPQSSSHSHMRDAPMTSIPPTLPPHHVSGRSELTNISTAPLPDLVLPPPPPLSTLSPDSPTDPFCLQGRLSPIPHDSSRLPPFSMTRSSSESSQASSRPSLHPRGISAPHKGTCRGCSKLIMAGEKSMTSKDGQLSGRYHKQCFACHTCRVPFQTADFYVHDDFPYCAQHYHAINGSVCNGCGHGIEGQYLKATTMKGRKAENFHPTCLKCSACQINLHDDYYDWMGRVYCERDAYRMAGIQTQAPSGTTAVLSPRPRPSPGPNSAPFPSRSFNRMPRTAGLGLPSGPRAGLRPAGPGSAFGVGNGADRGFLTPNPVAPRPQLPAGVRFPERRTTRLMMI